MRTHQPVYADTRKRGYMNTPWAPYTSTYDRPFRVGWDDQGHYAVQIHESPGYPPIMSAAHHETGTVLFSVDGGQTVEQLTPYRANLRVCTDVSATLFLHPLALPHMYLTGQLPLELHHSIIAACDHATEQRLSCLGMALRTPCDILDMLEMDAITLSITTMASVAVA